MKTRWTWLGGARVEAIEVVQDEGGIEVNVLPASIEVPGPDPSPQPECTATTTDYLEFLPQETSACPDTVPDIHAAPPTLPAEALADAAAVPMPLDVADAAEGECAEEGNGVSQPSRLRQAFGSYSITERLGMGTVRGGKMGMWGVVGEAAGYGLENVTQLGLPPASGFIAGCVLYAVNRAVFPDSKL